MLQHEFALDLLGSGASKVVEDEMLLHGFGPAGMLFPSAVVAIGHITFLKFLHDGLKQFQCHFLFWLLGVYLVSKFDEAMEVIGLPLSHPTPAVDQWRLDHLQFLPRYAD